MIKSKLAAIVCATTLAVTPGLVACGGSSSTDGSESTPATEETTEGTADEDAGEEASEAETADGTIIAWGAEGASADAKYGVLYVETRALSESINMAQLLLIDVGAGTAKNYHGMFTEDGNGTTTLMDTMSGDTITYTAPDADPETGEVKITIEGVGEATLTMVDDVDTVRNDIVDAIKANDEA